jgi:hypothetical protein
MEAFMSEWDERKKGFEKRHELEAALRFRALARRNKLIGLWAAEKLGLAGAAAEDYARKLVDAQVGADDAALTAWLGQELAKVDPPISSHRIERRILEATAKAEKEIFEGR